MFGGEFETFWFIFWCFYIKNGVGNKNFTIFKRNAVLRPP